MSTSAKRAFVLGLVVLALLHLWVWRPTEPHHNNDESRHVMTGVFLRDLLVDAPWDDPIGYAQRYYLQYPALGLLAWPPLFYVVEGLTMGLFGPSFLTGQLTVAGFALIAIVFILRWARITWRNDRIAVLGAVLFGLTPIGFRYARHVMLEMPCLAFAFAALFYFERYLVDARRGDPLRVGLFSAWAALTRFDALFLLPYFACRLLTERRLGELRRPAVLLGIGMALAITAPYYVWTWQHYGASLLHAAQMGTMPTSRSFDAARNLIFYPSRIPRQVDWPIALAALLGCWRWRYWPGHSAACLSLALAVYLTFSPMAELEDRHVIYWIPALTTWAAATAESLPGTWRQLGYALLLVGTGISRTWDFPSVVHGYAEAAQRVLAQPLEAHVVFFDGAMSGGFIYQVRCHDPQRRVTVLRGDKLVYGMRSDPSGGYVEWTPTSDDIRALLYRYDPDWIVIESPQAIFPELTGPKRLRQTLREHPDRYDHVAELDVPLRGTHPEFQGVRLEFYRPRRRNPNRERLREIPMLSLGRPLRLPAD